MKTLFAALAFAFWCFALAPAAQAQGSIVVNTSNSLNCTNMKGEHGFDAVSFSFGGSNTAAANSGSGSGAGKPDLTSLTIEKHLNVCSEQLIRALLLGNHLASVELTQYHDNTAAPLTVITLSEAAVTSYQVSGDTHKAATETISFSFRTICIASTAQNPDGSLGQPVTVCYNVAQNRVS